MDGMQGTPSTSSPNLIRRSTASDTQEAGWRRDGVRHARIPLTHLAGLTAWIAGSSPGMTGGVLDEGMAEDDTPQAAAR